MIRNTKGEAMGIMDAEEIAAWFMHHMTSEQRALFIAERPLVYARMYPEVSAQTITDRVTEHIQAATSPTV